MGSPARGVGWGRAYSKTLFRGDFLPAALHENCLRFCFAHFLHHVPGKSSSDMVYGEIFELFVHSGALHGTWWIVNIAVYSVFISKLKKGFWKREWRNILFCYHRDEFYDVSGIFNSTQVDILFFRGRGIFLLSSSNHFFPASRLLNRRKIKDSKATSRHSCE